MTLPSGASFTALGAPGRSGTLPGRPGGHDTVARFSRRAVRSLLLAASAPALPPSTSTYPAALPRPPCFLFLSLGLHLPAASRRPLAASFESLRFRPSRPRCLVRAGRALHAAPRRPLVPASCVLPFVWWPARTLLLLLCRPGHACASPRLLRPPARLRLFRGFSASACAGVPYGRSPSSGFDAMPCPPLPRRLRPRPPPLSRPAAAFGRGDPARVAALALASRGKCLSLLRLLLNLPLFPAWLLAPCSCSPLALWLGSRAVRRPSLAPAPAVMHLVRPRSRPRPGPFFPPFISSALLRIACPVPPGSLAWFVVLSPHDPTGPLLPVLS